MYVAFRLLVNGRKFYACKSFCSDLKVCMLIVVISKWLFRSLFKTYFK